MIDGEQEFVVVLEDVFLHFTHHPLLEFRVTVCQEVEDVFVCFIGRTWVVVLTLIKESLHTFEYLLRIGLIEPVMILVELLLESLLVTVSHFLHILLI